VWREGRGGSHHDYSPTLKRKAQKVPRSSVRSSATAVKRRKKSPEAAKQERLHHIAVLIDTPQGSGFPFHFPRA
jgi:hypothetical protein